MRILKLASFDRFAQKNEISDAALSDAVERAGKGQVDANLGGGVIKQRIARQGEGKSGGFRVIIIFRSTTERAFFVYGFAKNERNNIREDEKMALKKLAPILLNLQEKEINALIESGTYMEVK